MYILVIIIHCHNNPNWLAHILQRGWNHHAATVLQHFWGWRAPDRSTSQFFARVRRPSASRWCRSMETSVFWGHQMEVPIVASWSVILRSEPLVMTVTSCYIAIVSMAQSKWREFSHTQLWFSRVCCQPLPFRGHLLTWPMLLEVSFLPWPKTYFPFFIGFSRLWSDWNLWFMVGVTIVFMGVGNQYSHHWWAPSCTFGFKKWWFLTGNFRNLNWRYLLSIRPM